MISLTPQQIAIIELLSELTDREITTLILRHTNKYGLNDVGKVLNLSNERIRQIEAKAIKKLSEFIENYQQIASN